MSDLKTGDLVRFRKDDFWYRQTQYPYRDRTFLFDHYGDGYARIRSIGPARENDPEWIKDGHTGGFDSGSLERI